MTYPKTNVEFNDAFAAYEPAGLSEEQAAAIEAAKLRSSIVDRCVGAFNALRTVEEPAEDDLRILVGAAYLIAQNGWHGLGAEALEIVTTRAGELT